MAKIKEGVHLNRKYFWFWIVLIAIMAFITGELVNFMMLFFNFAYLNGNK